jgi:hypothetical protein
MLSVSGGVGCKYACKDLDLELLLILSVSGGIGCKYNY